MRQYIDLVQDVNGNALPGISVQVLTYPAGSPASIFSDNGLTPITNATVTTGADGSFNFFVADGDYQIQFSKSSTVYKTQSPMSIFDGAAQVTIADTGTVNALATSNSYLEKALRTGLRSWVQVANTNTSSVTYAYNGLAAKAVVNADGSALSGGELSASGIYGMEYNGTSWQISTGLSISAIGAILYPKSAAEGTAGLTIVNPQYPYGTIDRYVTNTTPGTTDCVSGMNAAWKWAQANKGGVITLPFGPYLFGSPANCTTPSGASQQYPITIVGNGLGCQGYGAQQVIFAHGGNTYDHGFDLTGSQGVVVQNLGVGTTSSISTPPQTAFFQARTTGGASCGICRFLNVAVVGKFQTACYYNYAAEDDQLVGCYMENLYTGGASQICNWTANNVKGLTSNFATVYSGGISCIDHQVLGGQYYNDSANAAADVFYLEAIESVKILSPWVYCASGSAGGRSIVYVDGTNGASNYVTLRDLTGEVSGSLIPSYFLLFSNNAVTATGWTIDMLKAADTTFTISGANASAVLDNFCIRGIDEVNTHGISWAGTIQNSVLETRGMPVSALTMNKCQFTGDVSQLTTTNRTNVSINDTGVSGHTWSPGIVSGTNGWTAVGAITQRGHITYQGNMAFFSITLGAVTSLACTAGATIALPFTVDDENMATIIDSTAGTTLSQVTLTSSTATIPVAISANTHTMILQGFAFVN